MPLTPQTQNIIGQLSRALWDMRDFLLSNPSDENHYKTLYSRIEKLSILVKIEGYVGYKHENPYKTLGEFLSKNNNASEAVVRYYLIPKWSRVLIKPSSGKKEKGAVGEVLIKLSFWGKVKRVIEWGFDQLKKVKPDIKI